MQLRTFTLKPQYFQQNRNHTNCSPIKIGVLSYFLFCIRGFCVLDLHVNCLMSVCNDEDNNTLVTLSGKAQD